MNAAKIIKSTCIQINKDFENFKKTVCPTRRTKNYLATRLETLEKNWQNIRSQFETAICSDIKEELLETTDKYYNEADDCYTIYRSQLLDELDKLTVLANKDSARSNSSTNAEMNGHKQHEVRLPKIQPPTFTGEYQAWRSFHDQFVSLVHNNDKLTKLEKLHYLKSCCKEGAGVLLEHINIDDHSYDQAWELLTSRYDFKRILVNNELKLLFELPPVANENSKGIRELLDNSTKILHALKNLDLPIQHWDAIIIFLLLKKLPVSLQSQWEATLGTKKEIPTFKEFSAFLESKFRTLEMIDEQNGSSIHKKQRNVYHINTETKENFACKVCNKGVHSLRTCSKFLKMDVNSRLRVVKQIGNCFNCLAYSHRTNKCPSNKTCHFCQRNHNSLLHFNTQVNSHHSFLPSNSFQQNASTQAQNNNYAPVNNPNSFNQNQASSNSRPIIQNRNSQNPHNQLNKPTQNLDRTQTHHVMTEINPNATPFHPYDIPPSTSNCFHLNKLKTTHVLLATAIVQVKSGYGTYVNLRALVDPGSQASFITESAAQLLSLRKHPTAFDVSVLGGSKGGLCRNFVELSLHSNYSEFETTTKGYVFKTLTGLLPNQTVPANKMSHIQSLKLADPSFHIPAKVDLLLGSEIYSEIVLPNIIRGDESVSPIAQKTQFGWIIMGKTPIERTSSLQVFTQIMDIDSQIRKFWEVEESPYEKPETEEDAACEKHFVHNTKRLPGGRFEVALPFKENRRPELKSTQQNALKMFFRQENKLLNNPTLHNEYNKCILEYLNLKQMEEVNVKSDPKINSPYHFVVPHHAVLKESSTTTKLRVVFNASFKTSDGSSLNDHLMSGPKTQNDIIAIVIRWRLHKISFTSDIEKMYRQIHVNPDDSYYQLLFWREDSSTPVKLYKVNVLMFGTAPAPYLANRVLKKLASDEESAFPVAAKMVREDMYVDDLVSGADTVEEAKQKYDEVSTLLSSAGFHLRKWMSNSQELLAVIPQEDRETSISLSLGAAESTKTLGICWLPATDSFSFQRISADKVVTKRTILSTIARFFDPLGWISPCIIKAKIMMQQLWTLGVSWDNTIPVELQQEWLSFLEELLILEDIRIPRWMNTKGDIQRIELHGFSDASIKAYGAVVYLRVLDSDDCIHTQLLISKTKVAPVNTVSLPRLELCGAVLLAKLLNYTKSVLAFKGMEVFAWTDSTITLCWIAGLPSRWKTFIANRVTEIHRHTNVSIWRYIPTKLNPADLASRGVMPSKIKDNTLWWNGPPFLQEKWKFLIPDQPTQLYTEIEKREIKVHIAVEDDNRVAEVICKYSRLSKVIRTIAYVNRFINNTRKANYQRVKSVLSALELEVALRIVIKTVQKEMFPEATGELNSTKRSKLNQSLNLFIDEFGIIRIGGRLENSILTYDQKHPIVLRPDHKFSKLIIEDAHLKTLHGGIQQVIAFIRNKFWIFNIKRTVKKYLNKCIICYKNKPKPMQQLMGNLPAPRVNISRPFSHTGVDYAGPIEVKAWKGRNAKKFKGYFAIFICLSTKAIHLEAVTDLTTQAFIAAFRRFTSRRGICANLYSDCGTNFKGANVELQKMLKEAKLQYTEIAESLSKLGTNWNFIPPASPHFGGLWEAGVKSVKYHLRRVAGNQTLTFEELSTLLAQIEVCLNSRPLCPFTDNLDDFNALTPAHFLTGTSAHIVPEGDLTTDKPGFLERWKRQQALLQSFWKEWSGEYLTRLQNRPKWLKVENQPKIGDLVLLKDERFPPSKWSMARITELYPGPDNLVRVVKVRTQTGQFKRPITKICPLPSNTTSGENTAI